MNDQFIQRWHEAINQHANDCRQQSADWPSFMYEAKDAYLEAPRLASLFRLERKGKLPKVHKQCSHSPSVNVEDNHLMCCLGIKTLECPHLKALDIADVSDAERDVAKAWTCVGHILSKGGDMSGEGYVLTVDDRMFWDGVHESLAMGFEDDAP